MVNHVQIGTLLEIIDAWKPENIGDKLSEVIKLRSHISDPETSAVAETFLLDFRGEVARAEESWSLFADPIFPERGLTDEEVIQLVRVHRAVHELCYCFERMQHASNESWGGSAPVRFYLNAIYHYLSSMFLVDKSKPSHKDLPMGGTVIRALNPLSLDNLLFDIQRSLEQPHGDKKLGEAILLLRHSDLVHGDFSVQRAEYLIESTKMRDEEQQERFSSMLWDIFYELLLLHLRLLAMLTDVNINAEEAISRYVAQNLEN